MHAHQISMSPQPWMVSRTSVFPALWHTNKHQLDRDDDGSCMLLDLPQTLPFNTTCSSYAQSSSTGTSMLPFVRKPAQRMEGVLLLSCSAANHTLHFAALRKLASDSFGGGGWLDMKPARQTQEHPGATAMSSAAPCAGTTGRCAEDICEA